MKKINTKIKLSLNKETISIIENMNTIRGGDKTYMVSDVIACDGEAKFTAGASCNAICHDEPSKIVRKSVKCGRTHG